LSDVYRYLLRLFAVVVLAAVVAGCSGDNKDEAPCPSAKVLGEPSELTRFREGPGRDPTDVLYTARMAQVSGECTYDPDGGDIDIELDVAMEVFRGAAPTDSAVDFSYFVAVAEWVEAGASEPVVRSREAFRVQTDIPLGRRGLRYSDLLEITIPRPDNRNVRNFVIYVGFELTREELSYNKRKLGL